MKNYKAAVAAGILVLLFPLHLKATNYTYNATIDITTPFSVGHSGGQQWDYLWVISGAPTFAIRPGDTVKGTISFMDNQALQFLGPVDAASIDLDWMDFDNTLQNHTLFTTTLLGVTGPLAWPNPSSGASFSPGADLSVGSANISTPTAVSFSGFSYSATVVSGSGNYMPYFFSAHTPNGAAGAISVVPEPSAAGLFGAALIILSRKLSISPRTRGAATLVP